MFAGLQGWHLIIIVAVLLLFFGAPKLPGLAKSIGQSMRIFKSEVKPETGDDRAPAEQAAAGAQPGTTP